LNSHKKIASADDGRRRREETKLQIRKTKKNEQLLKKRAAGPETTLTQFEDKEKYDTSDLPMLVGQLLNSDSNEATLVKAVRGIRRMLSVSTNPPVLRVIQAGAIDPLISMLGRVGTGELVFEAAWALTNIASTDHTSAVVDAGVIGPMVLLLRSQDPNVREQAAWCLGNISGDGPSYRDLVLVADALPALLLNVQHADNETLLGNVTWSISNLCRGKPQPALEMIAPALPGLHWLLHSFCCDGVTSKPDIVADALWALSYASDGDDDRIQACMNTGCTTKLVEILNEGNPKLITPALRTLGNFVTGNAQQTQTVIDAGIMEVALKLLLNDKRGVRKEACWLLSNISAGTQSQIGTIFKHKKIIINLVDFAINAGWEVRKEAIWSLSNIFTGGSDYHVQSLVQADGLEAMITILDIPGETRLVIAALDAIENILAVGERHNQDFITMIHEYGGIEKLEELQTHSDDAIYNKSINLIERYFGEEKVDENVAPVIDGNYVFGAPKNLFGNDRDMGSPVAQRFDFTGTMNMGF
jgi:importin subunit alpha-6/7